MLILDEPTRGIDVGVNVEVNQLIIELAGRGTAVMVVSSDLEELIAGLFVLCIARPVHI